MESFSQPPQEKSKDETLLEASFEEAKKDLHKFIELSEKSVSRVDGIYTLLETVKSSPEKIIRALALVAAVAGPVEALAEGTGDYQIPQNYWSYSSDVSTGYAYEPIRTMISSFNNSVTHTEFVANLQENFEGHTDSEKVAALARLGAQLSANYNYDMFQANDHVAITNNEVFKGLSGEGGDVGICGNIHKYLSDIATSMGLEAVIISDVLATPSGGAGLHSFVMVEIVNEDGDKEIIVINYDTVIQTGEETLSDALAAYQRTSGTINEDGSGFITMFGSYIQTADGTISSVDSTASKTLQEIAGMKSSREHLEDINSVNDEDPAVEVSINIAKGTEIITLNSPIYLSYGRYENPGDASNPIREADSLSAGFRITKEANNGGTFSASATGNLTQVYLHGPGANNEATNYFAAELTAAYQAPRTELMTFGEFSKVSGQFSAMARVAGSLMISGENIPFLHRVLSGDADIAAQYNIVFEQGNTSEFYVTAGVQGNFQPDNLEDQNITLGAETYFKIGINSNISTNTTLSADAAYTTDGLQTELDLNAAITNGNMSFTIGYEKNTDALGGIEENIIASLTRTDTFGGVLSLSGYTGNNDISGMNIKYGLDF